MVRTTLVFSNTCGGLKSPVNIVCVIRGSVMLDSAPSAPAHSARSAPAADKSLISVFQGYQVRIRMVMSLLAPSGQVGESAAELQIHCGRSMGPERDLTTAAHVPSRHILTLTSLPL